LLGSAAASAAGAANEMTATASPTIPATAIDLVVMTRTAKR
jgi:hypothetical protein